MSSDDSRDYEVDEPEELQNDASEDEWPAPNKARAVRGSRKRGSGGRDVSSGVATALAKKRAKKESSAAESKTAAARKTPASKKTNGKEVKPKEEEEVKVEKEEVEDDDDDDDDDDEPDDDEDDETGAERDEDGNIREFSSGAFVIKKEDLKITDPAIWKIDGKGLLEKYLPEKPGETSYKNTNSYIGWNLSKKKDFQPAPVVHKHQNGKTTVVEFKIEQVNARGR